MNFERSQYGGQNCPRAAKTDSPPSSNRNKASKSQRENFTHAKITAHQFNF